MSTIKECYKNILTGDMAVSRAAARGIRKSVYSSQHVKDKYKDIKNIINSADSEYTKISEDWRQENFVVAISVIYFLHDRENQLDFLFSWFFQLLQHKNGNIRQAAVRMINHELGSLTYHIRFPGESSSFQKLTPQEAGRILVGLETNLHNLKKSSWQKLYKKYKYINDLPSGTYKSVQMILGYLEDLCAEAHPSL